MGAALEQETIEIARDLIRIESVNTGDPATIGDGEERAARYVRDRLAEVGITGEFVLPTPGRGSLVVRATGKVLGTARCRRLQVEDGGQITGHMEMLTEQQRSEPARPISEPAPQA